MSDTIWPMIGGAMFYLPALAIAIWLYLNR